MNEKFKLHMKMPHLKASLAGRWACGRRWQLSLWNILWHRSPGHSRVLVHILVHYFLVVCFRALWALKMIAVVNKSNFSTSSNT